MRPTFALLALVLFSATAAIAQQNELGMTFGGLFSISPEGTSTCEAILICPQSGTVDIPPTFAFSPNFAHRVADFKAAAIWIELPLLGSPARSPNSVIFNRDFWSLFVTPSLRVQFAHSAPISPFLSAGGGFAYFSGLGSDTRWATQFGGGLDFKTHLPHVGFRVEVRDFITGKPSIGNLFNVTAGHLQQVYTGGGVVFKF